MKPSEMEAQFNECINHGRNGFSWGFVCNQLYLTCYVILCDKRKGESTAREEENENLDSESVCIQLCLRCYPGANLGELEPCISVADLTKSGCFD